MIENFKLNIKIVSNLLQHKKKLKNVKLSFLITVSSADDTVDINVTIGTRTIRQRRYNMSIFLTQPNRNNLSVIIESDNADLHNEM